MIGLALGLLMSFSSDDEDLIEWVDAQGKARALRGKITSQDDTTIYMSRRDGQWEIARKQVTKVQRRSSFVARTVDTSRSREETVRQAASSAMSEAAAALESALARNDAIEIATARKRLADARAAWRTIR